MSFAGLSAASTATPPARVVLADDEGIFRASLRHLFSLSPTVIRQAYGVEVGSGFDVVGEAESGEETIRVVHALQPDLLILDLSMPRMSGIEALRELAPRGHTTRTILLAGAIDPQNLMMAVQLGVRGLVLKDFRTELLFEAASSVLAGRYWLGQTLVTDFIEMVRPLIHASRTAGGQLAFGLTAREREVLTLVAAGFPNKEIARRCTVSEETIKHHLTRIFKKVGASNRLELAMVATRSGLDDGIYSLRNGVNDASSDRGSPPVTSV